MWREKESDRERKRERLAERERERRERERGRIGDRVGEIEKKRGEEGERQTVRYIE